MSDNPTYRGGQGPGARVTTTTTTATPARRRTPRAATPARAATNRAYPPRPRRRGRRTRIRAATSLPSGYEQRPPAGATAPRATTSTARLAATTPPTPRRPPQGAPRGLRLRPPQGDYDYGRPPGPADEYRQPVPSRAGLPGSGRGYSTRLRRRVRPPGRPARLRSTGPAATAVTEPGRLRLRPAAGPGWLRQPLRPGRLSRALWRVTLQLDDGSGRTYQLREGANVIGRGQDAQFRLPDTGVSRRHLEIRWDGQVALLSDLNSTNGTTVNNAPVQEWQLADGDVIRLGHSEIVVRVH